MPYEAETETEEERRMAAYFGHPHPMRDDRDDEILDEGQGWP